MVLVLTLYFVINISICQALTGWVVGILYLVVIFKFQEYVPLAP